MFLLDTCLWALDAQLLHLDNSLLLLNTNLHKAQVCTCTYLLLARIEQLHGHLHSMFTGLSVHPHSVICLPVVPVSTLASQLTVGDSQPMECDTRLQGCSNLEIANAGHCYLYI